MDIFSFVNLMLFILYKSFGLVLIIELAASLKHFKNNYVCKRRLKLNPSRGQDKIHICPGKNKIKYSLE